MLRPHVAWVIEAYNPVVKQLHKQLHICISVYFCVNISLMNTCNDIVLSYKSISLFFYSASPSSDPSLRVIYAAVPLSGQRFDRIGTYKSARGATVGRLQFVFTGLFCSWGKVQENAFWEPRINRMTVNPHISETQDDRECHRMNCKM